MRGDLQLSRTRSKSWGALRLTFDWLDFTLQREATGCEGPDGGPCKVSNTCFPVTVPMIGLRGTH